jgi:hypothetical protein
MRTPRIRLSRVGAPSRPVIAAEGGWAPEGDLPDLLAAKLSDCLWWLLVLGDRLDVDLETDLADRMDEIEDHLKREHRHRVTRGQAVTL